MCELFAVSSRHPARVNISLHELARHGGLCGPHRDGWGVAYHDAGEARVIKEPEPAWCSPWVELIQRQNILSDLVVSHIRQATHGPPALRNTQPYVRELGGRMHVFAHNGELGDLSDGRLAPPGTFRAVGDTDSEQAFCYLLGTVQDLWLSAEAVPPLAERMRLVRAFADRASELGPANFVYSDGDALFVHGDRRRHAGEATVRPPGLYALWRNFLLESTPFVARGLEWIPDGREEHAVLVASVPLTREGWIPLPEGDLLVLAGGRLVATAARGAAVAVAQ